MQHHLLALTDAALREELVELADEVRTSQRPLQTAPNELRAAVRRPRGLRVPGEHDWGQDLVPQRRHRVEGTASPRHAAGEYRQPHLPRCHPRTNSGRPGWRAAWSPALRVRLLVQAAVTLAPNARALRELVAVLLTIGPLALACALGGRILAGSQGARARRSDGRHGSRDHRHAAGSPPGRARYRRRIGPPGPDLQRDDRATPAILRGSPAVHRRRRPRAANPAGRDADRGRGRPPLATLARTGRRVSWRTCSRRSSG